MSAKTIWMMIFTQIIAIWTPGISVKDHLKKNVFVGELCAKCLGP